MNNPVFLLLHVFATLQRSGSEYFYKSFFFNEIVGGAVGGVGSDVGRKGRVRLHR